MSQSIQVGDGSPIAIESILQRTPAGADASTAGSEFGALMGDLELHHMASARHSSSMLTQGIDDLSKQVSAEMEHMQAPMQLDGSVASAIQDGAQRQLGMVRVQTAMAMAQTAANGAKKVLTDILNQK